MVGAFGREVAVATIIQATQRGHHDRNQRWTRLKRVDLFARYGELHTQGISQRQAAKQLDVPRSTLQAWRAYHECLDESPVVVAFFRSVAGLPLLPRFVFVPPFGFYLVWGCWVLFYVLLIATFRLSLLFCA